MININITIHLPNLWKTKNFTKHEWGEINLIVGPNGTGKSLFAEQVKEQLKNNGYKIRLLNAERLSGLEKQAYNNFTSNGIGLPLIKGFDLSKGNDLKTLEKAMVFLLQRS